MTRDLARAMVTTIELYLVYGAHLGPLADEQSHEVMVVSS
jgi:hypothetical protein